MVLEGVDGAQDHKRRDATERPALALRGLLRPFTLLLLAGEPTHGYELTRRLEGIGLNVKPAGVYRVLHRLDSAGHTRSVLAGGHGAGPDRQIWSLTESGHEELRAQSYALEHAAGMLGCFSSHYAEIAAARHTHDHDTPGQAAGVETDTPPSQQGSASRTVEGERARVSVGEVGIASMTVARLRHAGLHSLEEVAAFTEGELIGRGLWVGDIRKLVGALEKAGLSLREGHRGGPPRRHAGRDDHVSEQLPRRRPEQKTPVAPERSAAELGVWERDRAIVAARLAGDTLAEIGRRFALSRERVRQILIGTEAADPTRSKKARADREAATAYARVDEVLAAWRDGMGSPTIARSVGISEPLVKDLIDARASHADKAARRASRKSSSPLAGKRGRSDEELIAAIKEVAQRSGGVPSGKTYRLATTRTDLPSLSTVTNRFGGWSDALRAAGFTPARTPRRSYDVRWTEANCQRALHALVTELGKIPNRHTYARLASERTDLPCASTLHKRLGTWSEIAVRLERERAEEDNEGKG